VTLRGDLIRRALMALSTTERGWMSYFDLATKAEDLIRGGFGDDARIGRLDIGSKQVANNLKMLDVPFERRYFSHVRQMRFLEAGESG